jgi:hypothetical protein
MEEGRPLEISSPIVDRGREKAQVVNFGITLQQLKILIERG